MLETIFKGIFDLNGQTVIEVPTFLLCVGISLAIGIFFAFVYSYKNRYTNSFLITLALIPAVVSVVIMMVNGNIGAGVAVAGAFSLVRFRSVAGSAKEICSIFMAMCSGLISGMGYLGYAVLFSLILGVVFLIYNRLSFEKDKKATKHRTLRITIPEDLDYTTVFDDLMKQYTSYCKTVSVKTSGMGSLYRLRYDITLKDVLKEKEFIDELRCRNGNLEIIMSEKETHNEEL